MERLLVETDAPYLSPHPYRGKRNEPATDYFSS
ncbi:TatD family hydrolase [Staphylococcus aureus]